MWPVQLTAPRYGLGRGIEVILTRRIDDEIVGAVRDEDGAAVVGAVVRAYSVRMRGEEPLGVDAHTDEDGRYCIPAIFPRVTGAERVNVRVAVLDGHGTARASSPVRFAAHGSVAIDVVVPVR